jgi:hypothetical protein
MPLRTAQKLRKPHALPYKRMIFGARLRAICAGMNQQKLGVLVALEDHARFIETLNPDTKLTSSRWRQKLRTRNALR